MLLGRYPNEEDLLAVQKGVAAGPIGKPRDVASVNVVGVTDTAAGDRTPASLFTALGVPVAVPGEPGALPPVPSTGPVLSAAALKMIANLAGGAVTAKPVPPTSLAR